MGLFKKIYLIILMLSIFALGVVCMTAAVRGVLPPIPGWVFIVLFVVVTASFTFLIFDKKRAEVDDDPDDMINGNEN